MFVLETGSCCVLLCCAYRAILSCGAQDFNQLSIWSAAGLLLEAAVDVVRVCSSALRNCVLRCSSDCCLSMICCSISFNFVAVSSNFALALRCVAIMRESLVSTRSKVLLLRACFDCKALSWLSNCFFMGFRNHGFRHLFFDPAAFAVCEC